MQAMSVFARAGAEASDYGLIVAVALNKLPLPSAPPYPAHARMMGNNSLTMIGNACEVHVSSHST